VFVEFAVNASRDDAGAAAASGILKRDLGDIAAGALDVAPQAGWSPDPGHGTQDKQKAGVFPRRPFDISID
jgi:hypothetical protein